MKSPTGLALFPLGEYCVENGLPATAVELIEAAGELDPELLLTVRYHRASALFAHWLWLNSR